jgi:hypothetical protein
LPFWKSTTVTGPPPPLLIVFESVPGEVNPDFSPAIGKRPSFMA